MAQPGLDLGNVGFVLQGISRGRGPEPVHAQSGHLNPRLFGVGLDHGIDAVGRNAGTSRSAAQRSEHGTFLSSW